MALLQTTPSPNPMGNVGGNPNVMGIVGGNPAAAFGGVPSQAPVKAKPAAVPSPVMNPLGGYGTEAFNSQVPTGNNANQPWAQAGYGATSNLPPYQAPPPDPFDALAQLANQPYSPAQSTSGGSSIVQIGPGLAQIEQMLGLNNYKPPTLSDLTSQAANQVNLTLNPQIAAVQQQIAARNALGSQQSQDSTQNYSRLQDFINAATQQGQNAYRQAADVQGQDYQSLINGIGQNYANGKQAVNAEQSRLGLTGINNSAFDRDAQFLQGLASTNKQAAANTLAGQQANYTGSQNLLGSAEQSGGAAAQTKLAATLAAALGGLQQQQSSLEGSRGGLEQQALAQLQQQALANQNTQTDELLKAISAANSGMKTVSGGSTKVGATGLSPAQQIALLEYATTGKVNEGKTAASQANQAASQKLAQQNQTLNILKATGATTGMKPADVIKLLNGAQ